MTEPFVAEIRIFPFNFAPSGWAWCNGQILPIAQNTALFSLLGTAYGGNGQTTFALPNLQGRAAMHPGQGPGLQQHILGETDGSETVTLLESEMPAHAHSMRASQADAFERLPGGQLPATGIGVGQYATPGAMAAMAPQTLASVGGSQPHNNMQPYLTFYFNIALTGVFPPRS